MKTLHLALALCLVLTACGPQPGRPTPSESPQADPPLREGNAPPSETVPATPAVGDLTSPPALTVSTLYRADSVTAASGNYQWRVEMADGTARDTIACGASPLDEGVEWPLLYTAFGPGTFPPPKEGEFVSSIMPVYYLDFGAADPDTLTVRRWSVAAIGQGAGFDEAEEVSVEWTDSSEGRVPYGVVAGLIDMYGCYALYPLGDGEFVYEVNAVWGEVGSAQYVFQTIPQVRQG